MITLLSPNYTLKDITWFMKDNLTLQGNLLRELGSVDLRVIIYELKVPAIFISGDKDWVTPYVLVEEFYEGLVAPFKKMIYIKDAGHSPMMDDAKSFCEELLSALEVWK